MEDLDDVDHEDGWFFAPYTLEVVEINHLEAVLLVLMRAVFEFDYLCTFERLQISLLPGISNTLKNRLDSKFCVVK